jgi:hypothetical protein
MPSTVANANIRLAKLAAVESHHLSAHCAFRWTQGTVLIACRRCIFFVGSLTYVSIRSKYVSLWMFSINLKAVEASGFRLCDFGCKVAAEILVDDAIRGCEEGENIRYEVLFCRRESIPIRSVGCKVNFFSGPEGGFGLLVRVYPTNLVRGYPLCDQSSLADIGCS